MFRIGDLLRLTYDPDRIFLVLEVVEEFEIKVTEISNDIVSYCTPTYFERVNNVSNW